MDIMGSDLHIESPWSNREAQHRFLDLVDKEMPDRVILVGDTFEALVEREATLNSDVTKRLIDIARKFRVMCLPGNFPHDEYSFLRELAPHIHPIEVVGKLEISGYMLTHGAEWDPTIHFWNRFRWAYPLLPGLVRNFMNPTPSTLANTGNYSGLVRLAGMIHQSAQRHAIDNGYLVVFMGHTHLRQHLDVRPCHVGTVEVLGSLGQGPYICVCIEDGKYEVRRT